MREKTINFSREKNDILKIERDISFEDIILAIENGYLLDDIEHPNREKYPNQYVFVVFCQKKDYLYLVPYVENESEIFLKTIFPSRKMKKKYEEEIKKCKN